MSKKNKDDFYNPVNQKVLKESIHRLEQGLGTQHDLVDIANSLFGILPKDADLDTAKLEKVDFFFFFFLEATTFF